MNAVMLQAFEWYLPDDGKHFEWMKGELDHWKKSGITGIWLPPFTKATGTGDVGYGIYDLFDLGEFDQKGAKRTKYGTKEELLELIEACHERGIRIYADLVMNHKAGADETEIIKAVPVDENDRTKTIGEPRDIEAWTKFTFPGRQRKYSDFEWNYNHFSGVDFDEKSGTEGIFRILGENKGWSYGVSQEKGNYDYLMFANIDHAHPDVREEFFRWSDWLVETTGVDGFRLDAMKHIDDAFLREFIAYQQQHRSEDFYVFGEYWEADEDSTNHILYNTDYGINLFDVALHFNFYEAGHAEESYDLRKIFDGSLVKSHPLLAVTFVDNHDSQPGQALASFVEPWFKKIAYGMILLRQEGYPCVFFGDYYGIKGENAEGKHAVKGNQAMLDNLLWIRQRYAYGEQKDYFNDPNLIGWVRHGNDDHPKTGCGHFQ